MPGTYDREFAVSVAGTDATDRVVVTAAGELDMASAPLLQGAVGEAVAAGAARIVIDLGAVTFIDAAGLRALIVLRSELGQRLGFGSVSDQVQRLVRLTSSAERLGWADAPTADWPRPTSSDNVAYVKQLWEAFLTGGAAALAELVPDDVVWRPAEARGGALRGTDELVRFWSRRGPAEPLTREFVGVGDDVVVRAEFPVPDEGVRTLWSVYRFDGDRLLEAVTYDHAPLAVAGGA